MAFRKQQNRRIVINGETYIWYLKGNEIWTDSKHIAIRCDACPSGQLLLLDFYAHDFEIRPKKVREAIEFALGNGWTPRHRAKPIYISFDNIDFVRLPQGEQYLRVFQHPPSLTRIQPANDSQ